MLIDLETAGADVPTASDVCVIGAGIAGLLLAERLAARGLRVHLLEAGGLEQEERSQSLYNAEMAAERHTGTSEGRFRTLGGSSTRWGGQLLPYTPDIFTPPAGAPSLGWPMDDRELRPYYDDLQRKLGVDLLPFDDTLLAALGRPPVAFSPDVRLRFSKWIPFNKRNFARTLGAGLKKHQRITLFTHANATALERDPGTEPSSSADEGRIAAVRVMNYARREFRFTARRFIVAVGTVESSRLLLLSPAVPNPHDQIGRYFHDHLSFAAAEFTGEARERLLQRLGPFVSGATLHTAKLEATAELRAREHLLAAMAHIVIAEPEDSGAAAVRHLLQSVQRGKFGEAFGKNLRPMLRGMGDVARLALYAKLRQRRAVSARATVRLQVDLEQKSSPENRVTLAAEHDALGLPRASVHWRVSNEERSSATRYAHLIAAELTRLGFAPSHENGTLSIAQPALVDTFHPMGGLRMGTDARASVVDMNLRVHGFENLYVASCAVFPAGGSSNPTFTLMALSLRLADALASSASSAA